MFYVSESDTTHLLSKIIIIVFKGAIRNFVPSLHCTANHLQVPTRSLKWPGRNRVQIMSNTSSTYHVGHVMLGATWYKTEPGMANEKKRGHF